MNSMTVATSPEVDAMTGQSFCNGGPARSERITYDREVAPRLWVVSEQPTAPGRETAHHIQEVVR
jgi:hypothetical protein